MSDTDIKTIKYWRDECESLRQQLATTSKIALVYEGNLQASRKQLAECQAELEYWKILAHELEN